MNGQSTQRQDKQLDICVGQVPSGVGGVYVQTFSEASIGGLSCDLAGGSCSILDG